MPHMWRIGSIFELHGVQYEAFDVSIPGVVKAYRQNDYSPKEFRIEDLLAQPGFSLISPRSGGDHKGGTGESGAAPAPKDQATINKRLDLLEPVLLLREAQRQDLHSWTVLQERYPKLVGEVREPSKITISKAISCQAAATGTKVGTLWRYWMTYLKHGKSALVSRAGQGVHSRTDTLALRVIHPRTKEVLQTLKCRLSPQQVELVEKVVSGVLLNPSGPRTSAVYAALDSECYRADVPTPDESTIRKLLKRIKPEVRDRFHLSDHDYRQTYNPVERGITNREILYPLQQVQLDNHLLDIDALGDRFEKSSGKELVILDDLAELMDEPRSRVTGRPWLTLGIDVATRYPWAFDLSWEGTTIERAKRAILMGVSPKNSRERWGTRSDWLAYGVPATILVDNASEYHAEEFERTVVRVLHAEVAYRSPGRPETGPIVERLIETIALFIQTLPGTRKSSPADLKGYDPEKYAVITLSELEGLIAKYLVDIYPYEKNRGLPVEEPTPAVRWVKGLEKIGANSLRFLTRNEQDELKFELLTEVERTVRRDGFEYEHISYNQKESLAEMLAKGMEKATLKVDHRDMAHCYVHDGQRWVEFFATSPSADELRGVSLGAWKLIRTRLKQSGEEAMDAVPGHEALREAKAALGEEVKGLVTSRKRRERRKGHQMASAMKDVSGPTTGGVTKRPQPDVASDIDPDDFESF